MAKQALLFDYLEGVSWRILEEYSDLVRRLLRGRTGVYALYRGENLYYVGLASNMTGRIKAHLKDRHKRLWDRFNVYLTRDESHMRELEALILRIARPRGNSVSGRFQGATDLHRHLYRLMTDTDADRRARILGGYAARRRRRAKAASGRGKEVLGGLVDRSVPLRGVHRGKSYRATLRRDGKVRFQKKLYSSPSAAACVALGRTANGWQFWKFRQGRAWVRLDQLRK